MAPPPPSWPSEVVAYIQQLVDPVIAPIVGAGHVRVEHLQNRPLAGEHLFVVWVPPEVGGLVIGPKGVHAKALRLLTRAYANARQWRHCIDVRVKNTHAV